ncbi:hypothetical protein [Couchioplanes azureus]|uniref:hypothetical protein n=1 Tax=Couchioplanes caeruleus TaxID=56438 RepID=UPI00166FF7C5|nr:hypothetical protein [Couchioplanes caeruleus]GGQ81095.1 hypothetical protein GCM10010166_59000 [Couchioplanes caeruleus subsp. azureus]
MSKPDPAAVLGHAAAQATVAREAYAVAVRRLTDDAAARLPGPQFAVAGMRAACDTMAALLDRTPDALTAACTAALFVDDAAERVVTAAERLLAGDPEGAARLAELRRDLRATPPPVPDDRLHELAGKAALGIDPDATPRWL